MHNLQRINAKFFLADAASLSAEEAFRIFNDWIASSRDEVLVDVADYSHVADGPITLLVGHEANYSLDADGGRKGLLYARKQPQAGDLGARLRGVLGAALRACRRLETNPELAGKVRFRGDEFLLVANDRLNAPNTPASEKALRQSLDPLLEALFAGARFSVERDADERHRLALHVRAQGAFDTQILIDNLAA